MKLLCLHEETAFHHSRSLPCSNHLAPSDVATIMLFLLFFCLLEQHRSGILIVFFILMLLLVLCSTVQRVFLHFQDNVSRNFIIDMRIWEKCNVFSSSLHFHLTTLFALWPNKVLIKIVQHLKKIKLVQTAQYI